MSETGCWQAFTEKDNESCIAVVTVIAINPSNPKANISAQSYPLPSYLPPAEEFNLAKTEYHSVKTPSPSLSLLKCG